MPLGEVFSGVTMGLGITFLAIYVNAADQGIAHFGFSGYTLTFEMNVLLLLEILLVSLPCMLTIANIMLANNICDLEEDIANQRFTLPYYIGRKKCLNVISSALFAFVCSDCKCCAASGAACLCITCLSGSDSNHKKYQTIPAKTKQAGNFSIIFEKYDACKWNDGYYLTYIRHSVILERGVKKCQ